jgi:uncharacterized DUF497 family protein
MRFEWDESKNRINREKHGLNFEAVAAFDWENALLADRTRQSDGEQRYAALGLYEGKIHTVVFAKRGLNIRIISLRRSNRKEEQAYASAKGKDETRA